MRTIKTIGVIGSIVAILLSGTVAFAREQATSTSRENNGERRLIATTTGQRIGENARERMQAERKRAQASTTAMHERAKQRVAEIKDKAKQQMAQKLAGQFENINTTWTDHFMNLLDRYSAIVQKMQDRANIAVGKGKDATAANAAIKSASTAIVTAQTAVTVQAAKTYTPDTPVATSSVSSANGDVDILKGLRDSFKNLHNSLFKDLFALRDGQMKNARATVQNALQALKAITGIDDEGAKTKATSTEETSTNR